MVERTLGIIKPDAVQRNLVGRILAHIEAAGLEVEALRMVQLTEELARGFYAEHRERPFFGSLVAYMTSGPCIPMVLKGEGAIDRYRALMGKTDPAEAAENTLRKLFAQSKERNSVHGSDKPESAAREIDYFRTILSRWV